MTSFDAANYFALTKWLTWVKNNFLDKLLYNHGDSFRIGKYGCTPQLRKKPENTDKVSVMVRI